MEDQATGWRRGVDIFGERSEASTPLFDGFDDIQEIAERARQAIVFGDDDDIALAKLFEELAQLWAFPRPAADLVRKDTRRTGGL